MPRPSNTSQRRQEIVQGLMKAMSEKGYEKASIQAIAKAAGLSPGLIHYHFKTKLEILIALIDSLNHKAEQRYEQLSDGETSAEGQLMAWIDAALALGSGSDQDAVAAWVIIGAEAVRIEEVRELYQQLIAQHLDRLTEWLIEMSAERDNQLPVEKARQLASFILASVEGSYQLATTVPDASKDYAAETLKEAVKSLL